MQAVILAGGLGTRLRPLTYTRPKALLPLLRKPMVLHIMEALPRQVDEVIIAASYMVGALEEYFSSYPAGAKVTIVEEKEPLGTGGALKNLEDHIDGPFLVLNGDVVSSLDMESLLEFHQEKGGIGTIALWEVESPEAFGIVALGDDGRIQQFMEKPSRKQAFSKVANAGIYAFEEEILDYIPQGRVVSLEREVFPDAIKAGLYGMIFTGYWADAGTLEAYMAATKILLDRVGGVASSDCVVEAEAFVLDPVDVGPMTILRGGIVGPYVSLGRGCDVAGAKVVSSVLLDGVKVEKGAIVEDSLIGSQVTIGADSRVERCIVADGLHLERGSKLINEQVGP